mmetsp:Transcript_4739/g.8114  ORF Transcript_4739/g.8114 Transcript_4739/m.8114 type:complete len:385 (-) Transcript_4739:367-1521(-)
MEREGSAVASTQPVASSSMQTPASGMKRIADDAAGRVSTISAEESLAGMGGGEGKGGGRSSKKPRLVWTTELHQRFLNAVNHLGVKSAVPKTILQLMNVEGMTRENVASHLQKYRLYLKRIQGLPPNAQLPDDQRPNAAYGAAARAPAVALTPPGVPFSGAVRGVTMGGQQAIPGQAAGGLMLQPGGGMPSLAPPPGRAYAPQHPASQAGVPPGLQMPDVRASAAAAAAAGMGMHGVGGAGGLYRPQLPQGGYAFQGYGGLPPSTLAAAAAAANFGQPQGGPPNSAAEAAMAAAVAAAAQYSRMSVPPQGIPGLSQAQQQEMQGPGGMMVAPGMAMGGVQPGGGWWPGAAVSQGMMSAGGPPWLRDEPAWPQAAAAGMADLTKR